MRRHQPKHQHWMQVSVTAGFNEKMTAERTRVSDGATIIMLLVKLRPRSNSQQYWQIVLID